MTVLHWVGFAAGLAVLGGTFADVFRSLVLPRAPGRGRSSRAVRVTWRAFVAASRWSPRFEVKDRLLSAAAPLAVLVLLVSWLVRAVVGYALVLWPFGPFGADLREAGSSVFTLGFAGGHGVLSTVDYVAAATGLVVVALQIAYLPTLYGAFNRREALVTMMESRAGVPAWGPELLIRHQLVGIVDKLPALYADWERWAAEVSESHTTYPVLLWFRSPKPYYSWVVSLLAVLDSAAMYLAVSPQAAPSDARLCLRMGFSCLRSIAGILGLTFDPDPTPDQPIDLPYDEFVEALRRLGSTGFAMERGPEQAWPHFRGWRVNYEAIIYHLADRVIAPPAPWSGPRRHLEGVVIAPRRPVNRQPGAWAPSEGRSGEPRRSR